MGNLNLDLTTPAPRRELTRSNLPNGRALAVGGTNGTVPSKTANAYQPPFVPASPMLDPGVPNSGNRTGHTATPLVDAGNNIVGVLVTGGASGSPAKSVNTAEIYGRP